MKLSEYLRIVIGLWRHRKSSYVVFWDYRPDSTSSWSADLRSSQARMTADYLNEQADRADAQQAIINEARRLLRP